MEIITESNRTGAQWSEIKNYTRKLLGGIKRHFFSVCSVDVGNLNDPILKNLSGSVLTHQIAKFVIEKKVLKSLP